MNKKRFLVYKGDAVLSTDSLQLMGDFDTHEGAVQAIVDNHLFKYDDFFEDGEEVGYEEQYRRLQKEIRRWLNEDWQVYGGKLSYVIKHVNANEWLD